MNSRLVVDSSSHLREINENQTKRYPFATRLIANIFSYVFHPIFIPVYLTFFLIVTEPVLFPGFTLSKKILAVVRFFVMYSFFPLVTVLLLKALGFLDSIHLKTQKDRIIPYIASMIFYFWMWYVLRNQPEFPAPLVVLTFAIFLASIAGLLANIYIKISMHGIAMGIMIAYILLLAFSEVTGYGIYISVAVLVAGIVCSSRFIVSDHRPGEIYLGLFTGIAVELLADWARGSLY